MRFQQQCLVSWNERCSRLPALQNGEYEERIISTEMLIKCSEEGECVFRVGEREVPTAEVGTSAALAYQFFKMESRRRESSQQRC